LRSTAAVSRYGSRLIDVCNGFHQLNEPSEASLYDTPIKQMNVAFNTSKLSWDEAPMNLAGKPILWIRVLGTKLGN